MMEEKRRYHRLAVAVPMRFRVPPDEAWVEAAVLNISGTGVSLTAPRILRERQEVLMEIFPEEDPVEMHGRVVWVAEEPSLVGGQEGPAWRAGVRIVEPIRFDERDFLAFYARKLREYFSGGRGI